MTSDPASTVIDPVHPDPPSMEGITSTANQCAQKASTAIPYDPAQSRRPDSDAEELTRVTHENQTLLKHLRWREPSSPWRCTAEITKPSMCASGCCTLDSMSVDHAAATLRKARVLAYRSMRRRSLSDVTLQVASGARNNACCSLGE